MFKSIRWKFITIYFLLVFMAMVIIGVFLMQQFEQYHLGVVSDNLSSLANTVITSLIYIYTCIFKKYSSSFSQTDPSL